MAGIGIVLLAGPLSRIYDRFDFWLRYRKELGILSFFFGLAHGLISYYFLPSHFPKERFWGSGLYPFLFGTAAMIVLSLLFIISIQKIEIKLNRRLWWHLQNWGVRIAGVLILLHVFVMKWPGWSNWAINGGNDELTRPFMPPASLIGGIFGVFVLLIRMSEFFGVKKAQKIIPVVSLVCLVVLGGLFTRGQLTSPRALPLKYATCLKIDGHKEGELLDLQPDDQNLLVETKLTYCQAPDGRMSKK